MYVLCCVLLYHYDAFLFKPTSRGPISEKPKETKPSAHLRISNVISQAADDGMTDMKVHIFSRVTSARFTEAQFTSPASGTGYDWI